MKRQLRIWLFPFLGGFFIGEAEDLTMRFFGLDPVQRSLSDQIHEFFLLLIVVLYICWLDYRKQP